MNASGIICWWFEKFVRDHELNIAAICYKILHILTNNGGKYTPKRGENVQIEIQRKVWRDFYV